MVEVSRFIAVYEDQADNLPLLGINAQRKLGAFLDVAKDLIEEQALNQRILAHPERYIGAVVDANYENSSGGSDGKRVIAWLKTTVPDLPLVGFSGTDELEGAENVGKNPIAAIDFLSNHVRIPT